MSRHCSYLVYSVPNPCNYITGTVPLRIGGENYLYRETAFNAGVKEALRMFGLSPEHVSLTSGFDACYIYTLSGRCIASVRVQGEDP